MARSAGPPSRAAAAWCWDHACRYSCHPRGDGHWAPHGPGGGIIMGGRVPPGTHWPPAGGPPGNGGRPPKVGRPPPRPPWKG
eukprot:13043703-Alexandrium_andersonii.AAC.1